MTFEKKLFVDQCNEAVLKALFKINNDELTFEKVVQVATETKEATVVMKEMVYSTLSNVYSSTVAQVSKKQNFVKKTCNELSYNQG